MILIGLILQEVMKKTQAHEYGSYVCGENHLLLSVKEKNIGDFTDTEVTLFWNGTLLSTQDYDEHGITHTQVFIHTPKCIPIVLETNKETQEEIFTCLSRLIEEGVLEKDAQKIHQRFSLCSISLKVQEELLK